MGRRRSRHVLVVLASLLVVWDVLGLMAPGRADAAAHAADLGRTGSTPVAEVHVDAQAYEGQRGTILAGVRGRCAPGFVVAELDLDFSQGDVTTPSVSGQPFPCDGAWHRQRVSSLEAFEAGPATLTARLVVVGEATGVPVSEVSTTAAIYVRPAAKIELPSTVELRPHAVVKVNFRARCDAPWVLQDFSIGATQGEFPSIAGANQYLDLSCDGVLHPYTVWLKSSPVSFRSGWLRLDGSISLLDPQEFDPVTQATASRVVRVVRVG